MSQFNTFVEEKHKTKIASLVQQFVSLHESTESTLSSTDFFCLRQCVKEMARKLIKLIPHGLKETIKADAKTLFKHSVLFCPELLSTEQVAVLQKKTNVD